MTQERGLVSDENVLVGRLSGESKNCEATEAQPRKSCFSNQIILILQLSSYAIIGTTLRIFLARIFGANCESLSKNYLDPISLCITSSKSALFIDFPANMLGSLFMGMMIPQEKGMSTFPWLKSTHSFQHNVNMKTALQTAFCGSLTTFASWNSQMVEMMTGFGIDGTYIAQAITGYIIGVICSISCFQLGRHISKGLYFIRNGSSNTDNDDHDYEVETNIPQNQEENGVFSFIDFVVHGSFTPILIAIILFASFFLSDFLIDKDSDDTFNRQIWINIILSPFGTLLRWKLSTLNGKFFQTRSDLLRLFPHGTFIANMFGCFISIVISGVIVRLTQTRNNDITTLVLWLGVIKTGFAGNLSTVSSFIKELVLLSEQKHLSSAYFYGFTSILGGCMIGLIFYSAIIKI